MRFAFPTAILALASTVNAISPDSIPADLPLSSLLDSAQAHLSKGEAADALVYYDVAISRDPTNYLTLFKRGTTYMSLGRTPQARDDFNQVLAIQPGFKGAHSQLASLKSRTADWDGARAEYKLAGLGKGHKEVDEMEAAAFAAVSGLAAGQKGEVEKCIADLGVAISVASRSASLREARYACRIKNGDLQEASTDLQQLLHLRPSDTRPYQVLSALSFFGMNDMDAGLAHINRCFHTDPDSKICFKQRRSLKNIKKSVDKVSKATENSRPSGALKVLVPSDGQGLLAEVKEVVASLEKDGVLIQEVPNRLYSHLVELTCQGYYQAGNKKAEEYCKIALSNDENSLYGLLWDAKRAMQAEDFESAVRQLTKANDHHPNARSIIQDLHQKAQVALKRSKTKDYYKILDVSHDADERTIKKAYRARSKEFHPDKIVKHGISKEDAEKKMIAINEAYEVLSNPELRARFDRGDDPNDHEQARQGSPNFGNFAFQGFPFAQGGQFGGQRFQQFQFKF